MEFVMRLYLEPHNMTAMSNEIAKVGIHYLPRYDLFKLHGIILIFLAKGFLICGLSPSYAYMRSMELLTRSCAND